MSYTVSPNQLFNLEVSFREKAEPADSLILPIWLPSTDSEVNEETRELFSDHRGFFVVRFVYYYYFHITLLFSRRIIAYHCWIIIIAVQISDQLLICEHFQSVCSTELVVTYLIRWSETVLMGDPLLQHSVTSRNSVRAAGKDFPKRSLVAAIPRAVHQTIGKHVSFSRNGTGTVQNAAVFLLKVAVLEVVRRVSKAKCPHLWTTLQALQCFCYPPLKWFRRWAPFKDFIRAMQVCNNNSCNLLW